MQIFKVRNLFSIIIAMQDGNTLLHIASYNGHLGVVRYLCLTEKAAVNIQDKVEYGG